MTKAFDVLKAALDEKGTLTDEEIAKAIEEHGEMTPEENMELSAAIHERKRAAEATVTMEQYLEATKVLDTAPEGSPEYVEAEKIVQKFESAS
jgi:transcription elongation GreA/GreB family factor